MIQISVQLQGDGRWVMDDCRSKERRKQISPLPVRDLSIFRTSWKSASLVSYRFVLPVNREIRYKSSWQIHQVASNSNEIFQYCRITFPIIQITSTPFSLPAGDPFLSLEQSIAQSLGWICFDEFQYSNILSHSNCLFSN